MYLPASESKPPVLSRVLRDYLDTHTLKPRSRAGYNNVIRRCFLDWLYVPVTEISIAEMTTKFMLLSNTDGKGRGAAQAEHAFRILGYLFRFAETYYPEVIGDKLAATYPGRLAASLRESTRQIVKHGIIQPELLPKWYETVFRYKSRNSARMLLLLLLTGLRKAEIIGIKYGDIDLKRGLLIVTEAITGRTKLYPIADVLKKLLHKVIGDNNFPADDQYFLTSPRGDAPLSRFDRVYETIGAAIGLDFIPEDLRRTWYAAAKELGVTSYSIELLSRPACDDLEGNVSFMEDLEHLRVGINLITDRLLSQGEISREELIRRW